ncbi:hypothetical protein AGMMS49982_06780 [Bacteroidia bacterium]|nr:hypothetical protein AGMMS49982_06780 [Bacteroidia bacterium]
MLLDKMLLKRVSDEYGFDNLEFVNKDFYVSEVLKIISSIKPDFCDIIFTGGTCMSKAYGLIERMSEDVDMKINLHDPDIKYSTLKTKLSKLKHTIESALSANFPEIEVRADHGNRHFTFNIAYPNVADNPSLRQRIKLEFTQFPLRLKSQERSISSFVNLTQKLPPEVAGFSCIDPVETIAEKIISLTRRTCAVMETEWKEFDTTLIRHVYDIYSIHPVVDIVLLKTLVREIAKQDAAAFETWHPKWSADIATNTKLAMKELHGDKYAKMYAEYAGDMIYAKEVPDYETALNRIDEIIIDIFG